MATHKTPEGRIRDRSLAAQISQGNRTGVTMTAIEAAGDAAREVVLICRWHEDLNMETALNRDDQFVIAEVANQLEVAARGMRALRHE